MGRLRFNEAALLGQWSLMEPEISSFFSKASSKVKAGEVATWVTERAIQILGGNGYTREFPVERMHRDAKIYDIFEGTAEIQRLVISRAISGVHIR